MMQPHEIYLSLGATPLARQSAYGVLFRQALDPALVRDMRATVQTGTPLGNDRFRRQIEQTLQRSVGQPRRGRPLEKGY
jgi:putative transposase